MNLKRNSVAVAAFVLAAALVLAFFLSRDLLQPRSSVDVNSVWSAGDSEAARYFTATQCRGLLGKSVSFKGVVVAEECGKNCLGGCPNSGPAFCYYVLRDSEGCVVFEVSRIDSYVDDRFASQNKVFVSRSVGDSVEVVGTPVLYFRPYCNQEYCGGFNNEVSVFSNASYVNSSWCVEGGEKGFVDGVPECTYFLISDFPRE